MSDLPVKYAIQNQSGQYLVSFLSGTVWSAESKDASLYAKKATAEFVISRNASLKDCTAVEVISHD